MPASSAAHAVRGPGDEVGQRPRRRSPSPSSSTTTRSASTAASSGSWVTSTHGPAWAREVLAEVAPHGAAHLGVEGRERLVEQQRPRAGRQRPGQRHPLRLPAGQRSRRSTSARPPAPRAASHASACGVGPRARRAPRPAGRRRRCRPRPSSRNSRRSWNTTPIERCSVGTKVPCGRLVEHAPVERDATRRQREQAAAAPAAGVVLPAPFGPSTASVSPGARRVRSTSSTSAPTSVAPGDRQASCATQPAVAEPGQHRHRHARAARGSAGSPRCTSVSRAWLMASGIVWVRPGEAARRR